MTVYNDRLSHYISDLFAPHDPALQKAWDDISQFNLPAISIKPEEGRFLQFLARACGARRALEIGTLAGYSSIWIARGLLPGGKLLTLEKETRHAKIAAGHFAEAGLTGMIEIRVGDAHRLLAEIDASPLFDFIFIDADKPGYPAYFEWSVQHIRQGGVIAAHNAFRKGSVAGVVPDDGFTETMRAFNRSVADDERLISTIYPAGDGTLVSVKTV